jgi:hypothetical protein
MIYLRCSWRDISQISSIPISWAGRIKEQEAARQAPEDWLRKNKDQASLENYLLQGPPKPVIFQNITLQKIQITIIKSELQRLVKVLGARANESSVTGFSRVVQVRGCGGEEWLSFCRDC